MQHTGIAWVVRRPRDKFVSAFKTAYACPQIADTSMSVLAVVERVMAGQGALHGALDVPRIAIIPVFNTR